MSGRTLKYTVNFSGNLDKIILLISCNNLGRIVEVGEITAPHSNFGINDIGRLELNNVEFDVNAPSLPNNISLNREEVVHTLYDDFIYTDPKLPRDCISWTWASIIQENHK